MPYIEVNERKLHYADSHPQGAPAGGLTFICIHGLGSSQNYYFPILPFLTGKHRCITFDTYGSGRSPYTGHEQFVETIAADVLGILDKLSLAKAVVVGHSLGGTVVSYLAAQFPERVRAVVAIGPVHPTPSNTPVFEKRIQVVSESGMEPMADSIPNQATGSRSTPLQKAFIRELILAQNSVGYASLCKVVVTARVPNYAAVKAPFLLIAGDEDKSAPLDGCRHIFDNIASQNKRLEVLPGVGHWHCIEASDDVGRLIADFASTISP
ncbi:putative alpha/beta hydrolase [Thermoascus aurantiacus ATCC 26904]